MEKSPVPALTLTLSNKQAAAIFFSLKELDGFSPEVGLLYQQIENHIFTHIGIQELKEFEKLYHQGEL